MTKNAQAGSVFVFPGIDSTWPSQLKALTHGRPDLNLWCNEIGDALNQWAETNEARLTGWFTGPISERLLHTKDTAAASMAPWALAGCTLTGLVAAQLTSKKPRVIIGHSAGLIPAWTVANSAEFRNTGAITTAEAAAAVQFALLLGVAAHQQHCTLSESQLDALLGDPENNSGVMAAVRGLSAAKLNELISSSPEVNVGMSNSFFSHTVTGSPAALTDLHRRLVLEQNELRKDQSQGQARTNRATVRWEWLPSSVPFHNSQLQPCVHRVPGDQEDAPGGLSISVINPATQQPLVGRKEIIESVLVRPQNWEVTLNSVVGDEDVVVVVGSSTSARHITEQALAGSGALVTTVGSEAPATSTVNYSEFEPTTVTIDDRKFLDNKHTRLSGRSPMILPGMTPTTADVPIVAAAANAGFVAELAGGGQVNRTIFDERMRELNESLNDSHEVVFNALHLDPYLWDLHLGSGKSVQRAKEAGAKICGVTISGGVPEKDEAVRLLQDLRNRGIWLNALKPGTDDQIQQCLEIAAEYKHPLWLHIEGGAAGGHHSWEELDALLLNNYDAIRSHANIVIAAGGGVATPEQAARLLTGEWAIPYRGKRLPVDAVLLGTVTMAAQESTASAGVKALLAEASGTRAVVKRGESASGVRSGLSGLNADIHFLDNTAARVAALLDEVAGDGEQVSNRREEIIRALDRTAKPYFGELDAMTYAEVLNRFVRLTAVGDGGRYQDGPWLDQSHRQTFMDILHRFEGRTCPEQSGTVVTIFPETKAADDPSGAVAQLIATYPDSMESQLHPADVDFTHRCFDTSAKPMPFVAKVDADVRRRYQSDSLWQSHNENYDADGVLIIPGPSAVYGITTVDEPIAQILRRFEVDCVGRLDAGPQERAKARQQVGQNALTAALNAPSWLWLNTHRSNPLQSIDVDWAVDRRTAVATLGRDQIELSQISDSELLLAFTTTGEATTKLLKLVVTQDCGVMTVRVTAEALAALGKQLTSPSETVRGPASPSDPHAHKSQVGAATPLPDRVMAAAWPSIFVSLLAAEQPWSLLDLVHQRHQVNGKISGDIGDIEQVTSEITQVRQVSAGVLATVTTNILATRPVELKDVFFIKSPHLDQKNESESTSSRSDEYCATPSKTLGSLTTRTPGNMQAFADITGDQNPIHLSDAFAQFCGLSGRIVHGMWTSAFAQRALIEAAGIDASELLEWDVTFQDTLPLNTDVTAVTRRVGVSKGARVMEVEVSREDHLVATAVGVVSAPDTAYVFPGQGIQQPGMGAEARKNSAAASEVWQRADRHTRDALGFSVLQIVDENPKQLSIGKKTYRHPAGVLHLTQFTQVAMATLAAAQIAELQEAGIFNPQATFAGHSVGEYNALSSCTDVLGLEEVLELVFARGESMHALVPRDQDGSSNYQLAVIRPHLAGLDAAEAENLVRSIAAETGQLCEVVNLNLKGKQYAVAGTIESLTVLSEQLGEGTNGKAALILVPGIDVPFHSSALRSGVADFRSHLERCLPDTIDPAELTGRYIPNLLPRRFELTREYVTAVRDTCDSPLLTELLDQWDRTPAESACRTLLVELLAWQFASPVRWIETVDLLCADHIEEIVEIGVGYQPTLTNLIKGALALPDHRGSRPRVLNLESDTDIVFQRDADPEIEPVEMGSESSDSSEPVVSAGRPESAIPATDVAAPGPTPDAPVDIESALRALIALRTDSLPDEITDKTIDDLVAGASSRRNQLLLDLGKEFGISGIDGAQDLTVAELVVGVAERSPGYRYPGPILGPLVVKNLAGCNLPVIATRVKKYWNLEAGWEQQIHLALALGRRDGMSPSGSSLTKYGSELTDEEIVDAAISGVADQLGISVTPPQTETTAVDSGVVEALREHLEDALTTSAQNLLDALVPFESSPTPEQENISIEIDPEFRAATAPSFDRRRHVAMASGAFWARADAESLAHLAMRRERDGTDLSTDRQIQQLSQQLARFAGDEALITELQTLSSQAAAANLTAAAQLLNSITAGTSRLLPITFEDLNPLDDSQHLASIVKGLKPGAFAHEVALITGASPGSIAESLTSVLLAGGATVVVVTSNDGSERIDHYRDLERSHAAPGAELHVVRANLASYEDIDQLIDWLTTPTIVSNGITETVSKPALWPTLIAPFAATSDPGTLADTGDRTEINLRLLLLGVQRLIGQLGARIIDHNQDPAQVLLPMSPNHGNFGGDGAYAVAKSGLDTIVSRWQSEQDAWGAGVKLIAVTIGWVRGTGLMAGNDHLAPAVADLGVRTFTAAEMGSLLAATTTPNSQLRPKDRPWSVDLSGGLNSGLDLRNVIHSGGTEAEDDESEFESTIPALPYDTRQLTPWVKDLGIKPEIPADDMIVIAGTGEIGPWGARATRHAAEIRKIHPDTVTELAWRCGLIKWDRQSAEWRDIASDAAVAEHEIAERYQAQVAERCGIRPLSNEAGLEAGTTYIPVRSEQPVTLSATDEADARFLAGDVGVVRRNPSDQWSVTLPKNASLHLVADRAMKRSVGGQLPTGDDPGRYGLEPNSGIDPLAGWNLVATAEAFRDAGVEPEELRATYHPSRIGNTQGSGMGGMNSIKSLYVDPMSGREHANDLLQEALGNVISAHVNQEFVGGYGPMSHPVAACATAAVSLEDAVDKILLDKADIIVAGGWDDLSVEGIEGFADMAATADNQALLDAGISPDRQSRPGDRRRAGFVESAGGGSFLVCRGKVARELGLPVRAVLMYASSFGDGINASIPSPGLGALGAATGGASSPLAQALRRHGLIADDITVVSKHDTSTAANDPNEAEIHARIQQALGRSPGLPLRVISQKSLTGHAKGGAAAWQVSGVCDVFASDLIPGNQSLVSVDPEVVPEPLVVDYRVMRRADPVKAALVSSLGFGHVSSVLALAHPAVFTAAMNEEEAGNYCARANRRHHQGRGAQLAARYDRDPVLQRRRDRGFPKKDAREMEATLLLNPDQRFSATSSTGTGKRT